MPLTSNWILAALLREEINFFPKIQWCQSSAFQFPIWLVFTLRLWTIPMEISQILLATLHSQNRWARILGISLAHIWDLSFTSVVSLALQEFTTTTLCQIAQINAPSFLLRILSHTFPHLRLALGGRSTYHLSRIVVGGEFLSGGGPCQWL